MKVFTINENLVFMKRLMSKQRRLSYLLTQMDFIFGSSSTKLLAALLCCYFMVLTSTFSQDLSQNQSQSTIESKSMLKQTPAKGNNGSDSYTALDKMKFMRLEQAFFKAFRTKDLSHLQPYYTTQAFYQEQEKQIGSTFSPQYPQQTAVSKPELGWGSLVQNRHFKKSIFLQVPHRFHDQYTETIGRQWWQTNLFHMVMVNSAHRHQGKKQEPAINSDFSTAPYNPFLAATRAYIRAFKQPLVVQLHGYNRQKRKTSAGRSADIILSHGVKLPSPLLNNLQTLATCFKQVGSFKVKIYPQQVTELGATKNIIGDALRQQGYLTQFLHIEMSKTVRKKLSQDTELSMKMADCVYRIGS
jgi:hypothetical protein